MIPYHIQPNGPFHLGRRGVGLEATDSYIPSDTLFAAMLSTAIEIGLNPDDWLSKFSRLEFSKPSGSEKGKLITITVDTVPPFLLSSAFPRAGQVRFYPAPSLRLWSATMPDEKIECRLKKLKKIKYMSEGIFQKLITNRLRYEDLPPDDEQDITDDDKGVFLQGNLWLMAEEISQLPKQFQYKKEKGRLVKYPSNKKKYKALRKHTVWKMGKVPRVTIDRLTNQSNIFHSGRVIFTPDCGLWFGIVWHDKQYHKILHHILDMLGDAGIGGERSVGHGHFTWEQANTNIAWQAPQENDLFILLSRYHPHTENEIANLRDEQVSYDLQSVAGWITSLHASAQRRRRIWMFTEGSVLKKANQSTVMGDVVDVQPVYDEIFPAKKESPDPFPHSVWRYGLACGVAWKGAKS